MLGDAAREQADPLDVRDVVEVIAERVVPRAG
jgi:hypothetical protein